MRIIHTSDWHIGRTLHGVDLHEYHAQYFAHLDELVRAESVDAVLVSGDIYDRAIPPVDAVELLSDTLARLSEHTNIILTPGNHDSAVRLGFGATLMRPSIKIQSSVKGLAQPVNVTGRSGERARIYGIPYLDPDASRAALQSCCGEDSDSEQVDDESVESRNGSTNDMPTIGRSHESVMLAAMQMVKADIARSQGAAPEANIVMAHAFVVGGAVSESERDIRVGGVDSVPAEVFSGMEYVALGHLHGAQRVSVPNAVARYSGSPLAFSFSEMKHRKSSALLEFKHGKLVGEPDLIPAPVPRKLSEVSGNFDSIMGSAGDQFVNDWVRIIVTDPQRPHEMNGRLKERFPHALVMQHSPQGINRSTRESIKVNAQTDPAEVASQFVTDVTTAAPTAAEIAVLNDAFDSARAMDRSA